MLLQIHTVSIDYKTVSYGNDLRNYTDSVFDKI